MSDENSTHRYLCLWLPFLAADRWRRERDLCENNGVPLVFIEKVHGASCIAACDARAYALGLKAGLSLADARARHPDLHAEAFDFASDRTFLFRLAERAAAFSPTVGLDEPNGLVLDITGCVHLFGSEFQLARQFENELQFMGVQLCRIAVAPTPDMARALARYARQTPCFADDGSLVRTLPVAALESEESDTAALRRAGLKTIGDVASRPSVLFATRFSSVFTQKLARVLGEEDRRITPLRPPPVYMAEYRCLEPIVSHGAVETVLANLTADVSKQLRDRDEGGRLFESLFVRTDGISRRIRIETSMPLRDPDALMKLHRDRLEALSDPLDCGLGLDLVRLEVLRSEPCAARQISLDGRQERKEQIGQLIDRLGTMFGRDRVVRLRPENTHIPERAQSMTSAGDNSASGGEAWQVTATQDKARPVLLFKMPLPIEVENACDGELRGFRWRRVAHRVVHTDGPERIADEWWRTASGHGTRDYYRVEREDGRRFWIFRAEATDAAAPPRWFLHGLFA